MPDGSDAGGYTSGDSGGTGDGGSEAPAVRIIGRVDVRDPAGARIAWPGSRVIARFEGSQAKVRLAESAGDAGPSRYHVIVDGVASPAPLSLSPGAAEYVLATGLTPGAHTVELYRLTEAQVGTTQILGFDFPGGKLLAPPPPSPRRLEFLGDSTSNGYGIDGTAPCSFSGATQNESEAYPSLVAKALGAEHVHLAYSGKGVLQNYTRSDSAVFGVLYERGLPDDPSSAWAFPPTASPDAVFVNLGGNDWDEPSPAIFDPPAVDAFAAKYAELLATIRAKYPAAHVICALGPSQTDAHPAGYEAYTNGKQALEAAVDARKLAGDSRVYYFETTRLSDAYRTGCDAHPNAAFHKILAAEIAAAIKDKTGW